ncbi:MAG TPA: TetR family transcriptional regulator [Hyphomicrobiaceae bacterium]|nr:TetR family transcriptional regulator [Hyphomicrobiaceae bacterium]
MADRLEPDAWINAGLRALRSGGVEAVRVEKLAATLGVTKGSFYWHFKDRPALLQALLQGWRERATSSVIAAVEEGGGDARLLLRRLLAIVTADDGRLERAIRAWGDADPAVGRAVAKIDQERMAYVEALFRKLGFGERVARDRARFAYQALVGQYALSRRVRSADEREHRIELDEIVAMLLAR